MRNLIKQSKTLEDLPRLKDMMNESSHEYRPGDSFKAITGTYCDGFEVCLGEVQSEYINKSKSVMEDHIQARAKLLDLQNIMISARKEKTYLWFTLTSETSKMTDKTVEQLTLVVFAIRQIARQLWKFNRAQLHDICLNKIDFAIDCKGAFIPKEGTLVYNHIQALV